MENVSDHPLSVVRSLNFSYEYKSKLIQKLEEFLRCIESITSLRDQIKHFFPSMDGIRSLVQE